MAQLMLMKQIQKKKEENAKLGMALQKLAERRKIINTALKQHKHVADEKRKEALAELERQKKLIADREQLISRLKKEKKALSKEESVDRNQSCNNKEFNLNFNRVLIKKL